jgi:RNA polymerase sigma factor (sigma-70 family)
MEPVKEAQGERHWAEDTDEMLLSYMSQRDTHPTDAQAAWAEFYRRHLEYLLFIARRIGRGILDDSAINDLVQDVFMRAYERAETFDSGGLQEPEPLRRRARSWLGTIAKNILRDTLRAGSGISIIHLEHKELEDFAREPRQSDSDSPRMRLLLAAFGKLTKKEQYVLRVTLEWCEPGKHQRLPNHVAADLAKTLNTTSANIRQIRRRALQKIEQSVNIDGDS